ncbi:hypothetical protein SAMN05444336_1011226 [Albimonas donghaensis]|uniref:Uncharacterized protein n=1 Tax=Albimonas donghaensis TaxID=356660 RepID=A0A1H2U788_9RHOB|nr:hypothetical protein [Albimonas donghaensis]SDW51469.1 hypothetical protein SAMN05444336_1011226 [Albimonas donghaensis]
MTSALSIRLARAHGAIGPAAARRLRGRLEACDAEAPGAPSEILILRRLVDPAPGGLVPGAAGARAGEAAGRARWRRALEASLERARARAARPAQGPVPPGAEAVRFADAAEALACLIEDAAAGRAALRWWWRAWPPEAPGGDVMPARPASPGATLPGRTGGGAGRGWGGAGAGTRIARWLAADPGRAAAAIAVLWARGRAAAALAPLGPRDALALAVQLGAPAAPETSPAPSRPPPAAAPDPRRGHGAPSRSASPSIPGDDPPGAVAWLIAVARARHAVPAAQGEALAARAAMLLVPGSGVGPARGPAPDAESGPTPHPAPDPAGEVRSTPRVGGPLPDAGAGADAGPARPAAGRPRPDPADIPTPAPKTEPDTDPPAAARIPPDPAADPVPETGLETSRAGALFLLHLFERPDLAPALPEAARAAPWTAAARLAAALHPDPSPPGAPDPLAALMEALDGPSDAAPGGASRDPAEAGRLRAALDRALDPILPDLRARLAAAMGVAPETAGPRLVARRGRVFVTAMHVDLTLALRDADAGVRRAGLDLDPGWRPSLGRILAFHYRD